MALQSPPSARQHPRGGAFDAERGLRIVVVAGVPLGVTEGLQAAERFEEVEEPSSGAVNGEVGYTVSPGTQCQTGLLTQQVRLHAQIGRAGQPTAKYSQTRRRSIRQTPARC